jgi:hypothetical protein
MPKGRKRVFLPFAFLILFFCFNLSASDYIFKGFRLQNPYTFLKESADGLSSAQIKEIFELSGFFRSVSVSEEYDTIILSVVEFPVIKVISITGNSVYNDRQISQALGIQSGIQFNSRILTGNLQAFYRKCREDGYTHWQVKGIKIEEDGRLSIEVDEGILREVMVPEDVIDPAIIRKVFSQLVGKPFNALKVKYLLEELLFTGAFYTIDSEVLHSGDRVILKIVPDKKRLRALKSIVEYSGFGGFRVFNQISTVKKNNRLEFLDIETRFIDDGDSKFVQLSLEQYNFRRNLSKSFFSNRLDFFYTSFVGDDNFFFETVPSFAVPLLKNLQLSLSFAAGIHKNFNGQDNQLIAETRGGLEYQYRSPLNRTEWYAGLEWVISIMHRYNRQSFWIDFDRHFIWGDFGIYGQYNNCSGDDLPFNYGFIRFEKMAAVKPDQLFTRNFKYLCAEFLSRPIWGPLRLGMLAQVFDRDETEFGFGLVSHVTIKGFPLRVTGWIQEGKFYLSAGTRVSF